MNPDGSVAFFDRQFQRQVSQQEFELNSFELAAVPYMQGRVLDFGCGLGNLAIVAAQRGCQVLALDASPSAIRHLRQRAVTEVLPIEAIEADLRNYEVTDDFDCVVSISVLMCFDHLTAVRLLSMLQARVRPGGVAVINTLIEGTTYFDMFGTDTYCLFARDELSRHFAGWTIMHSEFGDFDKPGGRKKSFATLIARKAEDRP